MQSIVCEILIVIIGLVLASATKCLVDSEDKVKFLTRRSMCSSCKQELVFLDLIPIFSYLIRMGKCKYCKSKIPFDIFLYEFFTAIILIFYFVFFEQFIFLSPYYVVILIFLIFIAIEDVKKLEVVDELFYIVFFLNIFLVIKNYKLFSLVDFFTLVFFFHLLYFLARGGIGYGDIKVFCVLSLNLTLFEGAYLFVFTFLYAGFFAIFMIALRKVKRKTKIPLVPFIVLAYSSILLIREVLLW